MPSYFLDVKTLLEIVSRQKRQGTLRTEAVSIPKMRGTVEVYLVLEVGMLCSCTIVHRGQKVAEGEQALSFLYEAGPLEWSWENGNYRGGVLSDEGVPQFSPSRTRAAPGIQYSPAADDDSPIPRRLPLLERVSPDMLTRNQRRILAVIDGKRSMYRIYLMLSFSNQQEFLTILRDLAQQGLISW